MKGKDKHFIFSHYYISASSKGQLVKWSRDKEGNYVGVEGTVPMTTSFDINNDLVFPNLSDFSNLLLNRGFTGHILFFIYSKEGRLLKVFKAKDKLKVLKELFGYETKE